MTKYTLASRRRPTAEVPQTHAAWRGIGCVLILVVPLISWALAVLTVQLATSENWPLPYQLMGNPVMPAFLWKVPAFWPVLGFLQGQENLYAIIFVTVAYTIIAGALMSVVYAVIYRFVGPPRYGPQDAPPPKISVRRYKR